MGTGYKGGSKDHRALSDNLSDLKSNYAYSDGFFGEPGQGRSFTRNIYSDDPNYTAWAFFERAAYGGIVRQMNNGKGEMVKMKDGTIISYRKVSTSDGSPAVDINIRRSTESGGVKTQKIHFVKG